MGKKATRIMVFGTFDGLHKGHLDFFRQARVLSEDPFLIVSIARDVNVHRIKGKKPLADEKNRKKLVESCVLTNKVVLGGLKNYINHRKEEKPDIIALGYDQEAYIQDLEADLRGCGLNTKVIRMLPYKPHIYKNRIIHAKN